MRSFPPRAQRSQSFVDEGEKIAERARAAKKKK